MMNLQSSALEEWMRRYYHSAKYDIGSSGVQDFSLGELFNLLGIRLEELRKIIFNDNDTFGSFALKSSIANRWGNRDPNAVMVGNGSNEIIYHVLTSIIKKNDEIIILHPIYHTLGNLAESITCNHKYWKLDPENNWQPDLEELESTISSNTKFLIANFPHNPTGISLSKYKCDKLIDICSKYDITLIWDAAFQEITYGNQPEVNPCIEYKNSIYIGTLSKCFGLPGLRVGWCIAPIDIIEKCKDIKDYTSLYVSPLNDWIATSTIESIDKINKYIRPKIDINFSIFKEWLLENQEIVCDMLPQGGVVAFLRFFNNIDTHDFCTYLAENERTLVVPGDCFGYSRYFRVGFGQNKENLITGLEILSKSIKKYYKMSK